MTILTKNRKIYAKLQAARGAAAAVAAADLMRVTSDLTVNPAHGIRMNEINDFIGGWGMSQSEFGGGLYACTIQWRITPCKLSNGALVQEHLPLLRMCGLAETAASAPAANSGRNLELALSPSADKYGTIVVNQDGKKRTLRDCVGQGLEITFNPGGFIVCSATFIGIGAEADDALGGSETYPTERPYINRGASFGFNGVNNLVLSAMGINLGTEVPDRDDMTETTSYAAPVIVNANATMSCTVEDVLIATMDFQALLQGASFAVSYSVPPPTGAGAFAVAISKAKVTERSDGDSGGVQTQELQLMLPQDGDAPGIKFKWTDA